MKLTIRLDGPAHKPPKALGTARSVRYDAGPDGCQCHVTFVWPSPFVRRRPAVHSAEKETSR